MDIKSLIDQILSYILQRNINWILLRSNKLGPSKNIDIWSSNWQKIGPCAHIYGHLSCFWTNWTEIFYGKWKLRDYYLPIGDEQSCWFWNFGPVLGLKTQPISWPTFKTCLVNYCPDKVVHLDMGESAN